MVYGYKKNNILSFTGIVLLLYFAELVFPRLNTVYSAPIVCLGCAVLWLYMALICDPNTMLKLRIIYPLFFTILSVIYSYLSGYPVIANRYLSLVLIPLGNVIYTFSVRNRQKRMLKRVIVFVLILSSITALVTFQALLSNSYVSRSIKSSGEYTLQLYSQGIGGYSFIYFVAICSMFLLYFAIVEAHKGKKFLGIVLYAMAFVFIVKSNYMTAFLVLMLCSFLMISVHFIQNSSKYFLWFLLAVASVIFVIMNINHILNAVSGFLPSRIASVFVTNENIFQSIYSEFVNDRLPSINESWNSFMKHPLLGLVGSGTLVYKNGNLAGFGQHSYILDTFALLGFGMGMFNLIVICCPFRENGKWMKRELPLTVAMFACTLMIYLFNNATESLALAIGILYPYVRDSISEKRAKMEVPR